MSTRPHRRDRRVVVPATKGGRVDNISLRYNQVTTAARVFRITVGAFDSDWATYGLGPISLPPKASITTAGIFIKRSGAAAAPASARITGGGDLEITTETDIQSGDTVAVLPFHPDLTTPDGIVFAGTIAGIGVFP